MEKSKNIIIVGGGISGLTLLHYLYQKYSGHPEISIKLLEKNTHLGGTVRTISQHDCLFETGPHGFMANPSESSQTLSLIKELGLEHSLVEASKESNLRYIRKGHKLYSVPLNSKDFQVTDLIGPFDKLRAFSESFVTTKSDPYENVYAFVERRFGKAVAENLADPLISGIYAGEAHELILKEAFPQVYELEQKYGSILKGLNQLKKKNISLRGPLTSLKEGMAQLITALGKRYQNKIQLCSNVTKISLKDRQFLLTSEENHWTADQLYLCTPANVAASLLRELDPSLTENLNHINYAPISVVGLVYPRKNFSHPPEGFGYLVPSSEKSYVLGVLFESNIFPNRSPEDTMLLRVMIGGTRNSSIRTYSEESLVEIAQREIESYFLGPKTEKPRHIFFTHFPHGIPQYDFTYANLKPAIQEQLKKFPNLHLVANYWGGVSFNDCIKNAHHAAQTSCVPEKSY